MPKKHTLPPESTSAWEAIRERLDAASWSDLARKTGIHPSNLSRARSNPKTPLSENERRKLLRTLAYHFEEQAALPAWLEEIGWALHFGDEDFLDSVYQEAADLPEVHRLPRYLVNRPQLERQVLEAILPKQPRPIGELPPVGVVVSGLGGIGKSTLVRAALRGQGRLKLNFPDGVYWINSTRLNEEQVLQEMGYEFGAGQGQSLLGQIPGFQMSGGLLPGRLRQTLRGRRALFVLDGVESQHIIQTVLDQLPNPGCRFIFTTRQQLFPVDLDRLRLAGIGVSNFSTDQAVQLVESILHRSQSGAESKAISQVIERVEAHPMAIESLAILVQAAALTWRQVLEHLDASPMGTLSERLRECFDLTYERLVESDPAAARYFRTIGIFPRAVGLAKMLDVVSGLSHKECLRAIQVLTQYNLIWFNTNWDNSYQEWETHILLSDYAAERLAEFPEEEQIIRQRYFDTLLQSAEDVMPVGYELTAENKAFSKDIEAHKQKLVECLVLYDEILLRAEDCLTNRDFFQALRLLTGSSTSGLIMTMYMKQAYLLLSKAETEYRQTENPKPEVLKILTNATNEFKSTIKDIQANSVQDISEMPAVPLSEQVMWLHDQMLYRLMTGDIENCSSLITLQNDLIPRLTETEQELAWHLYYNQQGDVCFLQGDREGGIQYYIESGIIEDEDELETHTTYKLFHGWSLERLSLLRQVVDALIEQANQGDVAQQRSGESGD